LTVRKLEVSLFLGASQHLSNAARNQAVACCGDELQKVEALYSCFENVFNVIGLIGP
jgi:hypothetical protein